MIRSALEYILDDQTKSVLSLLSESGAQLHAMILRITLREDAAEDLMQDLFIRLNRRNALSRANNPQGYAVRTAMRLAFDWRRSQRRRPDKGAISEEPISNSDWQFSRLEQREDLKAVLDDMDRLTTLSRDILVMRYLEEQTCEEIGMIIGKTPHQIRALCHKAIARMRHWQESRISANREA